MSRLNIRKHLLPNPPNSDGESKIRSRPEYFERIREGAAKRWDQLEQDPDLAGPWHQLFKQVQSPRHVLSELLQNADDAGATKASVRIENEIFIFEHNGEDFTEEHFASLCRFGYSNKRALHTIGFRGIGFKSTFSLGDIVELSTPTLSIAFNRHRFTEPIWIDNVPLNDGLTQVRVKIRDQHRQLEVEKNLQEWLSSPVSLLFFKHIRYLRIQNNEVHWQSLGAGPVVNTEWVILANKSEQQFLLARSAFEAFPEESLSEIKEERMFTVGEDIDFPPSQVEIVLGAKGRLFVVLPTGVETTLPFACNAAFIQDPARLKIKDPETSPTNRWLLERTGNLATSVMLQWLKNDHIDLAERSKAYSLLPDVNRDDSSLEGVCAAIIEEAFDVIYEDKSCLLTNNGELKPVNQSIIVPNKILGMWPADQITALMDKENRPAFSLHVSNSNRKKLVKWKVIEEITREQVLSTLQNKHLPKPESWGQLLNLWAYVAPDITRYNYSVNKNKMCIVPVQGKDVLYSASEVVRLGEKRLLQSDEDWQFLATYLIVLNQNWPNFLADKRRSAQESEDKGLIEKIESSFSVLHSIGLEDSSDLSKVIEQVAKEFFSKGQLPISDCTRLAQIAAKLGATVHDSFRYVTGDKHLRSIYEAVLFDEDGNLEHLLPHDWKNSHLLHSSYSTFSSCTKDEWLRWVSSGRSGLDTFVPLVRTWSHVWGRQSIENEIRSRGYKGTVCFHYVTSDFKIEDWDFEEVLWKHWRSLAKDDDKLWGYLVERILTQPETFWSKSSSSRALHIATTGTVKPIVFDPLTPAWISKLRNLPCLPDTRSFYRKPIELFRRTPETEPFMDVELFVHGRLDNESNCQLLDLLGVSSTPIGPNCLLDCIRALSMSEKPPVYEVEKWYCRLDLLANNCSTDDFLNIKQAFNDEKIILTENVRWARASDVFLYSDEEDVPGTATVRDSLKDLTLWRKIGVPERPTADLAIQWLKGLPTGGALAQDDVRRVRALLGRHPIRIWNECGHWLNLAGEWVPTETIRYALTKQSLVPWSHLHEWVKQKTADLRLPASIAQAPPFSEIPTLASHIEEQFHQTPSFTGRAEKKPWLNRLGSELCRIILEDEEDNARIRALASDLADTEWQTTRGLETIPYIEGTPAGTPRSADVVWIDRTLYVDDLPNAKLARIVPDKLGKVFDHPDIIAALNYCFGRFPEDVTEYLEENFKLLERKKTEIPTPVDVVSGDKRVSPKEQDQQDKQNNVLGIDELSGPVAEPEEKENEITCKESLKEESEVEVSEEEDKEYEHKPDFNPEPEIAPQIEVLRPKESHIPRPARLSIIEKLARSQGYKKDGENRFYHADGSWIGKVNESSFPWEKRSASGDLIRCYWPKDHCLEREPLQLEADVWGLIDKFPNTYSLVLCNLEEEPVEIPGVDLLTMCKEGKITLYPATYRIAYKHA